MDIADVLIIVRKFLILKFFNVSYMKYERQYWVLESGNTRNKNFQQ